MKQNEAVRLALHVLGGVARLDKISLLALMFKDVDWSNTENPQASIRRIVRTDDYISPTDERATYMLVKPISAELACQVALVDDWGERAIGNSLLKERIAVLENALHEKDNALQKVDEEMRQCKNELACSISAAELLSYCKDNMSVSEQRLIGMAICYMYRFSIPKVLQEQLSKLFRQDPVDAPTSASQPVFSIQNMLGGTTNIGPDILKALFPSQQLPPASHFNQDKQKDHENRR